MATNYFFFVLFFFIFFLNTHARVLREMNYFNKATIDDKPLSAEEDAATFFTTQESSNGYGLYKNSAKDQEFQGFSSTTTNEESHDQDIPAKYSTDVRYNQGGSYATRESSNGYGLYKNSAKDQEFQGFSSTTTNEESHDQDIPAKYSTDVRYNQGGSYANTREEDEIYKSYADTKDSTKDKYKSDVTGYFADLNQQKGNGFESYDEVMKRFNEMQQYRNEEAKFQEGYEP